MAGPRISRPQGRSQIPSLVDDEEFESERPTFVDGFDRLSLPSPPVKSTEKNRPLLTILSGPERGQVFKLPMGEATIGRSNEADITIVDQSLSRIHARIRPSGEGFMLIDGGSTNGTFVEEVRLSAPKRIEAGTRFRLGKRTIVTVNLHDELEESAALSVHGAALHDRLTGVYNRGVFDDRLASEMAFAKRHKSPLSIVLFDIDFFKKFNDEYGHLTGDAVLVAVGEKIAKTVRTEDILARYGGEEFAVIARETPTEKAKVLGERIRRAVERCKVEAEGEVLGVTASVGIATLTIDNTDWNEESLIAEADRALYAAKEAGRNCVRHASLLPRR